jgi:hypothetical protein
MAHKNTLFQKLQQQISRHDLKCATDEFLAPNSARSFTHRNHLSFLIFCILNQVKSLRAGITTFNSLPEYWYHFGFSGPVKLSTVSEANSKRDWRVFRKLFMILLLRAKGCYQERFAFPLFLLDSSAITFKNRHTKWAQYSSKTDGIKVHVLFDGLAKMPVSVKLTQGKVADISVAKNVDMQPGALYVCDRAYWDSGYLYKQHRRGAFFIIRAKSNLQTYTLKEIPASDPDSPHSERILQLTGPDSQKYCEYLRAIRIHDSNKDEYFEVLTNNFDLPAESIAAFYKYRWQIELFFKWLKQNLKFDTLLGYFENSVFTQIWVAMITYLLLWQLYQSPEYSKMDFLEFLRYLRARLLLRCASIRLPKERPKNTKQRYVTQVFLE